MRVAVIGAGWFGCHIATHLIKKGISVTVYEKAPALFSNASKFNTGRLHLGFHYARSFKTRSQSREGFASFLQTYPELSDSIATNLYLVSQVNSILDFDTYLSIFKQEAYEFEIIDPLKFGFSNIEGGLICKERSINHVKAASYFTEVLKNSLQLSREVKTLNESGNEILVDQQPYDFCINCSYYTSFTGQLSTQVVYENVVTLLVAPKASFKAMAFVIMDGDFFSLNPFYDSQRQHLYTIYHVTESVVHRSLDFNEAYRNAGLLRQKNVEHQLNFEKLREEVITYYPSFFEKFDVVGSFVSTRTKLINNNANRECIVEKQGRAINVLSGKINSIFEAGEAVERMLHV